PAAAADDVSAARAKAYLDTVMDQFHTAYDVYTTVDGAGNHFAVRARMSNYDNTCRPEDALRAVPPMDESWATDCHNPPTCIRASFKPELTGEFNWGAWYFMNGIQRDPDLPHDPPYEKCPNIVTAPVRQVQTRVVPEPNWGDQPEAGVDLRGSTRLTFWSKGEKGGERVEFFALGVGWDPDTLDEQRRATPQIDPKTRLLAHPRAFAHPDASRKVTTRPAITVLTKDWSLYSIDLRNQDLSYVLGGFGWAANAVSNLPKEEIVFYLDDIRYELDPATADKRLDQPRFLVSYQTETGKDFDRVMRNAAYTYDNALALLAYIAAGDLRRAGLIAEAFVRVQEKDRFRPPDKIRESMYDGSLRNAYQAGDLTTPPGWIAGGRENTARLPGWYERGDRRSALLASDIRNPGRFANRLATSSEPLAAAIRRRMPPGFLEALTGDLQCLAGTEPNRRRQLLTEVLNRTLTNDELPALLAAYPDELEQVHEAWLEDSYSASLNAGNMAWVMLALLAYHERVANGHQDRYLSAAIRIGDWIVRNCDAGDGVGYTGGLEGFEPSPAPVCYKSTEHNIDLYAAFEHLYKLTGKYVWHVRAMRALDFVDSMWDEKNGMFWTGTKCTVKNNDCKIETNMDVIPLDIQAWAVLALRDRLPEERQVRALAYVEEHMRRDGGYDYSRRACMNGGTNCQDRKGVWYEGTAQMALAYRSRGDDARADDAIRLLRAAQGNTGAMTASDQKDGLVTGFDHYDDCIRYFQRPHVGATAWLILAAHGANPYWMGGEQ
ncbi:MAG TPA: hypothetical protein VNN08_21980, partial [Thermoanaerobaculia bacterium]|nr:hypothetical protein [Thermoanaerobaculia bacterium]